MSQLRKPSEIQPDFDPSYSHLLAEISVYQRSHRLFSDR